MTNMRVWGAAAVCLLIACGDKKGDQKVTGAGVTGAGDKTGDKAADKKVDEKPVDKPKDKKRADKLNKEQQKAYSDALKRGRKASKSKDWPTAIAAFEECLKIAADDAAALSELGWALYSSGNMPRAEEITRHAVALSTEARFKGANNYNLGMILLANKNTAGAIEAFKDSLRARPNETVRKALAKLDEAAAKEFELFAPAWMKSSRSPEDACKELAAEAAKLEADAPAEGEEDGWGDEICRCGEAPAGSSVAKPADPWKAVKIVSITCAYEDNEEVGATVWDLYVQTKDGWFKREAVASAPQSMRTMSEVELNELALRPGAGGAQVLLLRYTESSDYMGGGAEESSVVENLVLVGIGASGKPSITPAIELRHHSEGTNWNDYDGDEEPPSVVDLDVEYTWSFTPAGEVTLEPKSSKGLDGKALGEVVGTHPIVFP